MQGELAEFTLTEILQLYAFAEKSGNVTVIDGDRSVCLTLENGTIIGLSASALSVRENLLKCELLPERSQGALESLAADTQSRGLSFVMRNLIDAHRWELFVTRQIEQLIYPILNESTGRFEGAVGPIEAAPLQFRISVQQLVLDGSRWEAESSELQQEGYNVSSTWRRLADGERLERSAVSTVAWLCWATLIDDAPISDLAARLCLPELLTASAIKKLHLDGLLQRSARTRQTLEG